MKRLLVLLAVIAAFFSTPRPTSATELITNGGFETGTFSGWTVVNPSGWLNWQVVTASFNSGGFFPNTAPPEGLREAYQGTAVFSTGGGIYTMDQTITIPAAATASIMWRHRLRVDLASFCSSAATCGVVVYQVQILNTANVLLQTLYTRTAPSLAMTDTGSQLNLRSLSAFAGQTIKIRFMTQATANGAGPGQLEVDAVSVQTPAIPTAADATISGRLTTSDGVPISGGIVSLSGGNGESRTAISNQFGYYVFPEVPTGHTYVIGATSKRYFFPDSPVAINLSGDLTNVNFQASP